MPRQWAPQHWPTERPHRTAEIASAATVSYKNRRFWDGLVFGTMAHGGPDGFIDFVEGRRADEFSSTFNDTPEWWRGGRHLNMAGSTTGAATSQAMRWYDIAPNQVSWAPPFTIVLVGKTNSRWIQSVPIKENVAGPAFGLTSSSQNRAVGIFGKKTVGDGDIYVSSANTGISTPAYVIQNLSWFAFAYTLKADGVGVSGDYVTRIAGMGLSGNGFLGGQTGTDTMTANPGMRAVAVGNWGDADSPDTISGCFAMGLVYSRAMSTPEMDALVLDPFAPFKEPRRRVFAVPATGDSTLTAEAGTFTLAGQAAGLEAARELGAELGTFALAGQDAGLAADRLVASEAGAFLLDGQDVELTYSVRLDAQAGTFALAGQDAGLLATRELVSEAGAFLLDGQDVGLISGAQLDAEAGSFALDGQDATFEVGYAISAAAGAFTLDGQGVDVDAARVLVAAEGAFAFAGYEAGLLPGVATPTLLPAERWDKPAPTPERWTKDDPTGQRWDTV